MQFQKTITLASAILAVGCLSPAHAGSYTYAAVLTPLFNGYEQLYTPIADGSTSSLSRSGIGFLAMAQTSIGVNKIYALADIPGAPTNIQAASEFGLMFNLSGAAPGYVDVVVSVAYDFTLTRGASSESGFRITVDDNFIILDAYTQSYGAGDHCSDWGINGESGACAGFHSGTIDFHVPFYYQNGPNQILKINTHGSTFGVGLVDAFNTAHVTAVTLPENVGWSYSDLEGNPLNFQNQSTVPEPASLGLMVLGLGAMLVTRVRRGKMR